MSLPALSLGLRAGQVLHQQKGLDREGDHWPRVITIASLLDNGCGLSLKRVQDGCNGTCEKLEASKPTWSGNMVSCGTSLLMPVPDPTNSVPQCLSERLKNSAEIGRWVTWSHDHCKLHVPHIKTEWYHKSSTFKGIQERNSLPSEIRTLGLSTAFRTKLQTYKLNR